MEIIVPILVLGGLGLLFGVGLALASKKFCVAVDPRLEKIYEKLPGANCGACGMPGCMGFAEGLIQGTCTVEKCAVSEEKTRDDIARILGVTAKKKTKQLAVVHCHGGNKRAKDKFEYSGIKDCIAANLVMGGPKACFYGCIGFGTCTRACPFGAITMNEEDLPVVNADKCTACGKCVAVCPKSLFSLVPLTKVYAVRCKSLDLGKEVMQVCSVGCIACRKCEKACPTGAIKVIDGSTALTINPERSRGVDGSTALTINPERSRGVVNLAVIDYNICDNRGACFQVCPTSCIAKKGHKVWSNEKQREAVHV